MAQTALVATADDATIESLYNFAIAEPANGVQLYTDTGNAPTSTELAAGLLFNYFKVRVKGTVPIFNNTDMTRAHIAAYATDGTVFITDRIGIRTVSQWFYKIAGGTYDNDYLRFEDVEILWK